MSDTVYFQGESYWAKVYEPVFHPQFHPEGQWSINVALDNPSLDLLSRSGLRLQVKDNGEEGQQVQFRRSRKKVMRDQEVLFDPPQVVDNDGNPMNGILIGNGSKVTVKVVVYDSKFGRGHRLEAVRVEELVPYENEGEVMVSDGVDPF